MKVYVVEYQDRTYEDGSVGSRIQLFKDRDKALKEWHRQIRIAHDFVEADNEAEIWNCISCSDGTWKYDDQCGHTYNVTLYEQEVK